VDARRAGQLRQPADGVLHLAGGDHHQVRQLVDDDDDLRHGGLVLRPVQVVALHVAHAQFRKLLVAPAHLGHCPVEGAGGLLGVGHDGDEQVRNAVVDGQLDHLRVDHDQLDLVGRGPVEDRAHDAVDAHRFAGAGGAGDQHVGHLREVGHDVAARVVTAQRHGQPGRVLARLGRLQHVAKGHHLDGVVGHLDADGGLAGDRRLDAHADRREVQRDVVGQRRDAADLDARRGGQLEPRDRRAVGDADQPGGDAEARQRFHQLPGLELVGVLAVLGRGGRNC